MRLATSETQFNHAPLGIGSLGLERLRPAIGFLRPSDVVKDPDLSAAEKRSLLASWASDASAVKDQPTVRWLLGTPDPVPLNEVLEALARLDGADA